MRTCNCKYIATLLRQININVTKGKSKNIISLLNYNNKIKKKYQWYKEFD